MPASPAAEAAPPEAGEALTVDECRAALREAGVLSRDGRWLYGPADKAFAAFVRLFAARRGAAEREVARLRDEAAALRRRLDRAESALAGAEESMRLADPYAASRPVDLPLAQRIAGLGDLLRPARSSPASAAETGALPRPLPGLATAARLGLLDPPPAPERP